MTRKGVHSFKPTINKESRVQDKRSPDSYKYNIEAAGGLCRFIRLIRTVRKKLLVCFCEGATNDFKWDNATSAKMCCATGVLCNAEALVSSKKKLFVTV